MVTKQLQDKHRHVIRALAQGFFTLSDIADVCRLPAHEVANVISDLESMGYLRRRRNTGTGFFEFSLLDEGKRVAADICANDELELVSNNGVCPLSLRILHFISEHPRCTLGDISAYLGLDVVSVAPYVEQLQNKGLISVSGWFYRRLSCEGLPEWARKYLNAMDR